MENPLPFTVFSAHLASICDPTKNAMTMTNDRLNLLDGEAIPVLPAQLRARDRHPGDLLPRGRDRLLGLPLLPRDPARLRKVLGRGQQDTALLSLHCLVVGVRQGETDAAG